MKFTDTEKGWLMESTDPEITRQHIFNWEQGGGISMKFLPQVAKVKRVPIEELIKMLLAEEKNGQGSAA